MEEVGDPDPGTAPLLADTLVVVMLVLDSDLPVLKD